MSFNRLVRFAPKGDGKAVLIGEPVDPNVDVGKAVRDGEEVKVKVFSGSSVLSPGSPTDKVEVIDRILSPLAHEEVGTIRCIGLNYKEHAAEGGFSIPDVPTVFLKPAHALADPWPAPTIIPKHTLADDSADFESELAVVLGRPAKNVSEADALSYVLGYTAANDVSSRVSQLNTTQWSYSKGYDTSCPIGPALVSAAAMPDPSSFRLRGLKNGDVVQDTGLDDLIFNIPKLVSFLSQGTTLPAGTLILTGTPAGIGWARKPRVLLHEGDEFVVEVSPHIGSLYNVFENEK
ncbi:Fumarylacetoacetate hydrolase domain-containing protein 2 [Pleurostoma richardsiae]|uniref:Fumarylacetoacetate hydrolase domain-containing protein 2 n=1 Tax=Pleurostoma richardsiae TaxID=41990 RepID=A0AA38VV78_9PEZI|nr:Fumarylacetoacetate hydrolase domain-containing protein 2 [Pleurostoma richardsiae]